MEKAWTDYIVQQASGIVILGFLLVVIGKYHIKVVAAKDLIISEQAKEIKDLNNKILDVSTNYVGVSNKVIDIMTRVESLIVKLLGK